MSTLQILQDQHHIVGRARELTALLACVRAERHVLLEGPVGVGKTAIARAVAEALGRGLVRVDGDGRYSEALLDRFELVRLDYQGADEEAQIVRQEARCAPSEEIIREAVTIARATRGDSRIRRGASVRAAVAIADLAAQLDGDVSRAAELALPTRIELMEERSGDLQALLDELKKKSSPMSSATPR